MNDREALQLALDALEANLANWNAKQKAIPIIKQALEQPEPKPFGWYVSFGNEHEPNYFSLKKPKEPRALIRPLYTSPKN